MIKSFKQTHYEKGLSTTILKNKDFWCFNIFQMHKTIFTKLLIGCFCKTTARQLTELDTKEQIRVFCLFVFSGFHLKKKPTNFKMPLNLTSITFRKC